MVKAIKDLSKLGVAILKIALFFIPIIAVLSGMLGVVGMMMDMENPALEISEMGPPDANNNMIIPVNYSISNPTNFEMKDYVVFMGIDIEGEGTSITVWSNSLNIGDILAGETAEGSGELVLEIPSGIDLNSTGYETTNKMRIGFKTGLGLVDINLDISMEGGH